MAVQDVELLVLETPPQQFADTLGQLRSEWRSRLSRGDGEVLDEVREVTLDLESYLPKWNLLNPAREPITAGDLAACVESNYELLRSAGGCCSGGLGADAVAEEAARLRASNLLRLARLADEGVINARWGNDYASGLKDAMRRGAIVVTTNPQLVNIARKEHPDEWAPVRDRLRAAHSDPEELAKAMTMEVVLKNARLLRPVYRATDGAMGYVSFQLNPKKADDADAMVADAEAIFAELRGRFEDGEPNVVFKVPGTYAGVRVAEALTAQGIGINVTVNYAVPQQLAFGEAIEKGNARHSYLTNMDGRLDDPVGAELGEGKADHPDKASSWAGIAVAKKAHKLLYQTLGYRKSILLDASGRGPWHITRSLPGPDEYPVHKTVFPDKQAEFDASEVEIQPTMREEVPKDALDKLYGSKLFRQAYEVNGLHPLEFDAFEPAVDTLTSFSAQYDEFVRWCEG